MKTFVQAAGIFIIIVLTIFFMSGKFSSTTSEVELQNTLDNAVDHALYVAMSGNEYTIDSKDELAADIMHELFTTCNVKANYKIAFNVIDLEHGLVDVQVTQKVYVSPLMHSEVTCRRTIILEEPFNPHDGNIGGNDGEPEVPDEEEASPPILAANNSWWTSSSEKSAIKSIHIVDEYAGGFSESWPAGEDKNSDDINDDDVMCYVNGTTLIISGNGFGRIYANSDSSHAFEDFTSVETIEGLDMFDTSNATNMNSMFKKCYVLKELDVSGFDTSKVTDLGSMFFHCRVITSLNTSGFETSKVTDMSGMFSGCYVMTILDLSNFDTSNVTDMSGMFSDCKSLTSLDISSFVTTKVTNLGSMFAKCNSLTSLDLSHFVTASVTDMSSLFSTCSSLASLNITSFNTANVTDMYGMFYACEKLTSLDLSSFDTSKLEEYEATEEMFYWCNSLTSIIVRTEADKEIFERVGNSVPDGCTVSVK